MSAVRVEDGVGLEVEDVVDVVLCDVVEVVEGRVASVDGRWVMDGEVECEVGCEVGLVVLSHVGWDVGRVVGLDGDGRDDC